MRQRVLCKATGGAADLAMYLLSPQGPASLKAFGFIRSRCRKDNNHDHLPFTNAANASV
jgi:hypothetical protein